MMMMMIIIIISSSSSRRRRRSSMDESLILMLCILYFICAWNLLVLAQQNANTTDPGEVASLQSIASKLGLTKWNFSIDPCSWNNTDSAPYIKCDCTGTNCHVTTLYVYNLNIAAEIPLEIMNLTYLSLLNMGLNLFYGSIPTQIGRLTSLQYLDIGVNQLSGSVPSEMGNLTKLVSIGIGTNLLVGTFPRELGNLTALTGLYMDGSGLSGEIPTEFSKLTHLTTIWMFGNDFSGKVPDVFGGMSQLLELRMYGNNFSGPIPPSLLALTSIKTLSIGDLADGGSFPSSFSGLRNLTFLSLRHNGINGSLPDDLGGLTNLQFLDLSFNNLTGTIPDSFASLQQLYRLFLTSNNLHGNISVLGQIPVLANLDVSNNQFSGSIPTWVNRSTLEANLVWNYFEQTDQNSRVKYATFNCLDKASPCNRTALGTNTGFRINCGGPETNGTKGTYSANDETLGNSSYFQSADGKWSVSSTGYDSSDASFSTILSSTNTIQGTFDQAIYTTARGAANSLKYYGLGMMNGVYNVDLHFAEISITGDNTWKSHGQRFFDVYIMGVRVLKDFNIRTEANGSYKASVKSFSTQVKDNVLEIHLLWAGKGTCSVPTRWTYGPLISAIVVAANFTVPTLSSSPASSKSNIPVIVGSVIGVFIVLLIAAFIVWRKAFSETGKMASELSEMDIKPHMFTYNELRAATGDFNEQNKLGEGGFGAVYKGHLSDGTVVAVKRLSSKTEKSNDEFLNEVGTISSVQHRNLVKLMGCCVQGNHKILVFEFLENNSLQQCLHAKRKPLDWIARFNICIGIARGLAYLHEEARVRIVHRDIKASNILLDEHLNPKIGDFGLAKLFSNNNTHVSTRVAGTIGYLAPEYVFQGRLTEKADVYSFGILLLEIVSGRSCTDPGLSNDKGFLLEWVWGLYEEKKVVEVVDEALEGNFDEKDAEKIVHIALLCTQAAPSARPRMSEVLSMLTRDSVDLSKTIITRPGYLADLKNFTRSSSNPLDAIELSAKSSVFASTSGRSSYAKLSTSFPESR